MGDPSELVLRTLREIIAPLVEADGGVVYLVRHTRPEVGLRLHLAGACGGCPGVRTTRAEVIEPALRAAGFKGELELTSGWIVPEGAERIAVED